MLKFDVAERIVKFGKDLSKEEREKGVVRYYAKRTQRAKVGIKHVVDEIVQRTSLTRGDVHNAIMTLADVVNSLLVEGISVDLGDLGSLSVEAYGKLQSEARAVTAATIGTPKIRYNPKLEMKRHATRVKLSVRKPSEDEPNPPAGGSGGSDTTGSGGGHSGGSEGIPL